MASLANWLIPGKRRAAILMVANERTKAALPVSDHSNVVTLLENGVGYVAGYQGAPISHLMDVLADANDILDELGVHFESSASEATASDK